MGSKDNTSYVAIHHPYDFELVDQQHDLLFGSPCQSGCQQVQPACRVLFEVCTDGLRISIREMGSKCEGQRLDGMRAWRDWLIPGDVGLRQANSIAHELLG